MPTTVQPSLVMAYAPLLLFSLVPLIFWIVIAWRAMRAHERIADSLAELAKKSN